MNNNSKFWLGFITFIIFTFIGLHTSNVLLKDISFAIGIIGIISALFFEGKRRIVVVIDFFKSMMGKL